MSVEERIKSVMMERLSLDNPIKNEDKLLEDIKIDSLDLLDLVMCLEEEFDCDINNNFQVSKDTTVQDVIDYVERQVG